MIKKLLCVFALFVMATSFGCTGSTEIKEPDRDTFNSGELSPSTADSPRRATESTTID
jgi:hypothetical protein